MLHQRPVLNSSTSTSTNTSTKHKHRERLSIAKRDKSQLQGQVQGQQQQQCSTHLLRGQSDAAQQLRRRQPAAVNLLQGAQLPKSILDNCTAWGAARV
jgi:hypothetical protein